ncbi:MAG: ice-binding family protein [Kiritimatiellae bacterium]|jgi:hypothetical protein|nr:ice-binding family protein [Kiritimatiellia bacterium]
MKQTYLTCILGCVSFATSTMAALVPMGTLDSFAVLGGSTVTNTGSTVIEGDLGVYPGTAITGFFGTTVNDGPGTFSGTSHQADAIAEQAQVDAGIAYTELVSLSSTQDLTGQDLGGLTLTPGVFKFTGSAQLTGTLTLDGAGAYVFQIGSTLTTAAASSIQFQNGANPFVDVYWQIGTSSTLGANTVFGGTLIADQSQTLGTSSSVDGRVIALNGAVTLDNNTIGIPEIGTFWLVSLTGLSFIVLPLWKRTKTR